MSIDPWPQDGSAAAGVVQLPNNIIKLLPTFRNSTGQQLTQRGKFLYDPWKSTYNIGETVVARLVVALDFEDLPQAARQYIAHRAARVFTANKLNNQIASAEQKLGSNGRLLVRPSGTEPVIRVMGEGDDKALVEAAVDDVIDALTKAAA